MEENPTRNLSFTLDLGRSRDGGRVYADVRLSYERNSDKPGDVPELGISFAHTPKGRRPGTRSTSYGQLSDLEFEVGTLGYDVRFVWAGYHLNTMHAGCEHQRAAGWERTTLAGSLTHVNERCPVCGYRFGTKWLTVELPARVIEKVKSWAPAVAG